MTERRKAPGPGDRARRLLAKGRGAAGGTQKKTALPKGGIRSLLLLALALLTVACGGQPPVPPPSSTPQTGQPFHHIFLVVMENLSYTRALQLPGVEDLARTGGLATSFYAVAHPSLPNYLALTSGGTWGVRSDCWFCYQDQPNIASQLQAAHIAWGAYMEGLPAACWLGPFWPPTGYAGKHDPFRYYRDIRKDPQACSHIRPLSDLLSVLEGPSAKVPSFVWITPNLCHDGHSCPPPKADRWLAALIGKIMASPAFQDRGLLIVTWDEGAGTDTRGVGPDGRIQAEAGGGHIATLVTFPGIRPGIRVGEPMTPYTILATVEDDFSLKRLGNATRARTLAPFWNPSGHGPGA